MGFWSSTRCRVRYYSARLELARHFSREPSRRSRERTWLADSTFSLGGILTKSTLKISVKSSDVIQMVRTFRLLR